MRLVTIVVALALAAAGAVTLAGKQFPVALARLDCVNQPSSRLLVNDSTEWAEYTFDASMQLNLLDGQGVYVVKLAPGARLVVCVG